MPQDVPARLYVVTGNHVVDDGRDVLPAAPAAPAAPLPAAPPARHHRLPVLVVAGAGLTVLLALLGRQPWPLPVRSGGLPDVPQSLLTFLVLCATVCVWAAGRLVRPADTFRSPAAARLWWGLVTGAAVVSSAGALSLAAAAGSGQPPGDLVLRCLMPMVPAVLAGVLASDAGRDARIRAALGTGLVTLPLGALGWALLSSRTAAGLDDVLAITGLGVLAPLALAVSFVAADRRSRTAR
ncbi:hypothetical protein [Modestobacter lapidis]|nr:hypothetical protein [Modestobacter lapidis]